MRRTIACLAIMFLAGCCIAFGATATTTATTQSSQPATVPAATRPAVSKRVERTLDRLEKKRREIRDLQADIKWQLYEPLPDVRRTRIGILRYRAATKKSLAKFLARFDTRVVDGVRYRQKEWFCFDGQKLREVRERTKTVEDHVVVKPGEKIDPFELGKGPFPLPFGQKKREMINNFDITLAKPNKKEQAEVDLLKLVPKKGTRLWKAYKRVEFLLDRKDYLPSRVISEDRDGNITTVWFSKVKINVGLKDNQLWKSEPWGYKHTTVSD